jgi:predicted transcriptional regulator
VFDSLTVARRLTDAGIERAQADAIADGIRQAAEHGEHVTPDQLDARVADVSAAISAAETRMTWRMLAVAGLVIAAPRFLG